MVINWSPQRSDDKLAYSFAGEVITATLNGQSDTFDFSALPDGEAAQIKSTLPVCPVLAARRVNGRLEVTLLKYHGPNPAPEEAFPEPMEVS